MLFSNLYDVGGIPTLGDGAFQTRVQADIAASQTHLKRVGVARCWPRKEHDQIIREVAPARIW